VIVLVGGSVSPLALPAPAISRRKCSGRAVCPHTCWSGIPVSAVSSMFSSSMLLPVPKPPRLWVSTITLWWNWSCTSRALLAARRTIAS